MLIWAFFFGFMRCIVVQNTTKRNKTLWLNTGGHRGSLPNKQTKSNELLRRQIDDSRSEGYSQALAKWAQSSDRSSRSKRSAEQRKAVPTKNNSSQTKPTQSYSRQKSVRDSSTEEQPISIEFFYALATDSLATDTKEVNLLGITGEYVFKTYGNSSEASPKIEFLASAGLGMGLGDDTLYDEYYVDGYWAKDNDYTKYEYTVLHGQISLGSNIRWQVGNGCDFFVGARLGLSYFSLEVEETYTYFSYKMSSKESAFGVLYGVRIGTDISLTKDQKLTLAVDWWGSTARPKVFDVEANAQSYLMLSAGYKFTF